MLGAIVGDIIGSRYEWDNHKSKDFPLFDENCRFTDDSVLTIAVADALLACRDSFFIVSGYLVDSMQWFGKKYPDAGWSGFFGDWLKTLNPKPYGSYSNRAANRVSPVAWVAASLEDALDLADEVTNVTHNHPESIKGAEAVTAAVYMSLHGNSKEEIKQYITENYYPLGFTLDEIRREYEFDISCRGSVPQALEAFFESKCFEDAIRNAVSIGGDSDTIRAITGSVAEAYYGIPQAIRSKAMEYIDPVMQEVIDEFEEKYGKKVG